jgi:plastocyanin
MRNSVLFVLACTIVAGLVLASCGPLDEGEVVSVPTADTATVTIFDYSFKPQTLEIDQGTKLTWVNKDPVDHNVTAENGDFDHTLKPNESWSYTFDKVGNFSYTDRLNTQTGLKGTITVR